MSSLKSTISNRQSPATDPVVITLAFTKTELLACARAGFGWPLPRDLTERFIDTLTLLEIKQPSEISHLQSGIHS